jgi:Transposase DDE domain group 1
MITSQARKARRRGLASFAAAHPPALAETRITIRGDSYYGRPEVMDFCEKSCIDFVFGVAGNAAARARRRDHSR